MPEKTRVFCGGLPHDITKIAIQEFFSKFGTVEDVTLPVDSVNGNSRGYCFIKMASEADAVHAFEANGMQIDGYEHSKKLFIDWARPRKRYFD